MSDPNSSQLTFAQLDQTAGVTEPQVVTGEEYPLPAWYRAIRDVPLDKLSVEDVSKACRQAIHLKHVIPLALKLLEADPLAGEMYDGELLVSLKSVPLDYWSKNELEWRSLKSVIEALLHSETVTAGIREDAEELLRKTLALS